MDQLKPFQVIGAKWLASKRFALLADMMGLGKTPQAVHAADLVGARRVAVICPAIGRINWRREFERWSLLGPDLFIESYERIRGNEKVRQAFRDFRPDVLIIDEGHYLKSREAKQTRRIYGHNFRNGLTVIPSRVWVLTGTPTPNNITELYTHLRALWPGLIMRGGQPMGYMDFLNEFADWGSTDFGVKVFGNKPSGVKRIREILSRIMLRRRTEDVMKDMPPLHWQPTYLIPKDTVTAELRRLEASPEVAELRRVLDASDDGTTRSLFVAEEPIVMAGVRRITAELKARPMARIISEELENGAYDKIVIFGHHLAALDILAKELEPFGVNQIRGGQSDAYRQTQIDSFQKDPQIRVMVVQQKAGYHSITLTAAAQVAFLEQSWTPDENVQAAKRCHRIGQTRTVFVRNFGLEGSIDEAVAQVLSRKAQAILEIMEN